MPSSRQPSAARPAADIEARYPNVANSSAGALYNNLLAIPFADRAEALTKEGGKWILKNQNLIPAGSAYLFRIGRRRVYDLNQPGIRVQRNVAGFHSVSDGSPVILDPALYRIPAGQPEAKIQGLEKTDEFMRLSGKLAGLNGSILRFLQDQGNMSETEWILRHQRMNAFVDSLDRVSDPLFDAMFAEKRLGLLLFTDPVHFRLNLLRKAGADSALLSAFYASGPYPDFACGKIEAFRSLNPKNVLLTGEFADGLLGLNDNLIRYPLLRQKLNLPEDGIEAILHSFLEKSGNDACSMEILFKLGKQNARKGDQEKAFRYWGDLKKRYPSSPRILNGDVDAELQSLRLQPGVRPPEIALEIRGKILSWADFKGRFVLLYFWGTWCEPCKAELPFVRKLSGEIPKNKLQVIGMARDAAQDLENYLAHAPLPFLNTAISRETAGAWGVSDYPASFLIGPDQKIAARGFRGEKLGESVKRCMEEYEHDRTISQ